MPTDSLCWHGIVGYLVAASWAWLASARRLHVCVIDPHTSLRITYDVHMLSQSWLFLICAAGCWFAAPEFHRFFV